MSTAEHAPEPRQVAQPQATSGIASGSAASRWRGGNQKPNIVGARNAATSSCAAERSRAHARPPARSRARSGTAAPAGRGASARATRAPTKASSEHRRPAQQPVLAVDEQGHEPVGALEVAAGEARVGGALAGDVRGIGRGPAVERLVDRHVQRELNSASSTAPDRQRPPARRARARGPRPAPITTPAGTNFVPSHGSAPSRAKQANASRRATRSVEPQRQQRRAGERRAGGELGVDGAAVRQERRREPDGQRRAERPRVGHHAQRQPVRRAPPPGRRSRPGTAPPPFAPPIA